jgi:hypothetical protein
MKIAIKYFYLIIFLAGLVDQGFAQWQTQKFTLNQGWNAIYTHVDPKHTTIEQLVQGDGIEEVWMWRPKLSTMQYIQSPDQPLNASSHWTSWKSSDPVGSSLQRIIGNAAFLVKAIQPVVWSIKGKPVPPRYQWTSTGLNFIGFSTPVATQSVSPPVFSNFLNPVNGFGLKSQIFAYSGGNLSEVNPAELSTRNSSTVNRGQAYWIRATGYNRYYGPFELDLQDWGGVRFGTDLSSYKVILKNTTKSELTVSMQLLDSEAAPVQEGIRSIAGIPPIITRGDFQQSTLTHGYSGVNNDPQIWTLKPSGQAGSVIDIHLGVHWAQLGGSEGDLFAGILRFTDSLGYLQTDLPLSVTKPSTTGLWVGQATVNQVRHGMQAFQKSIVKGEVKAARAGTASDPINLSWLKKEAVRESSKLAGESYIPSDLGYHLIKAKRYTDVGVGDSLWLPTVDENGSLLSDPASYWQARPYHEAFEKGWYWDDELGLVVATGDKKTIDIPVRFWPSVKAPYYLVQPYLVENVGATFQDYRFIEKREQLNLTLDQQISPPSTDEFGVNLDDWNTDYWIQGNDAATRSAIDQQNTNPPFIYKSKVNGPVTIAWRKLSKEDGEVNIETVTAFPGERFTVPSNGELDHPPLKPSSFIWEGALDQTESGSYLVTNTDNSWGKVARPVKLRVIVHNGHRPQDSGSSAPVANLLQRVYVGLNKENDSAILATDPNLLSTATPEIRRVSAVHLPWTKSNQPWQFNGAFSKGGSLVTTVYVGHDDHASNPFLHTYHPDHDNLDPRFESKLPQGVESYRIDREIKILLNGSQAGFTGLAMGGSVLSGEYEEIITLSGKEKTSGNGNETRQYGMKGSINFRRITPLATLRTK